jgi:ATP-dependent Clp protease ATP-binding subunit ClpA
MTTEDAQDNGEEKEWLSRWQREFKEALKYKMAIILCGNIRDKYLCQSSFTPDQFELLDLKNCLLRLLDRSFNTIQFYDPIRRITNVKVSKNISEKTVPIGKDAEVKTALVGIRERLDSWKNLCIVFQYADKATASALSSWPDRELMLYLEKIVENIIPGNKLILIYLSQTQIPMEIFQNQPKSKIIEIPPPGRDDLRTMFKYNYGEKSDEEIQRAVNATDGLKLFEIEQILENIGKEFKIDRIEEQVRLYKFGKEKNPWDEVRVENPEDAFNYFTEKEGIAGQDDAIEEVINVLIRAKSDIIRKTGGNPRSPRGVLFFAGPTGVGKTETAKKLASFLFGSEDAFLRFDMSEFNQEHTVTGLYGAPPSYIGFEQGGRLTNAVKAKPFSVILFDEIEKAHPKIFDIFLQILSDGRLTDSKGEVAFFSESIIIFTSNLGTRSTNIKGERILEKQEVTEKKNNKDYQGIKEHFLNSVKSFFTDEMSRPELLGRIGEENIVVFNFIDDPDTIKKMFKHHLINKVQKSFDNSYKNGTPKLNLLMDVDEIARYLQEKNQQKIGELGGRVVETTVNRMIRDQLALRVIEASSQKRNTAVIKVQVKNDKLEIKLS